MRNLVLLAGLFGLTACGANQAPPQFVQTFCQVDGVLQPIVVPVAGALVTAAAPGAGAAVGTAVVLDDTVVHPAIVAACAKLGGVPTAPPAKSAVVG